MLSTILAFVASATAFIPTSQEMTVLAPFVESTLRLIPSQKPLSVLYFIEDGIRAGVTLVTEAVQVMNSVADFVGKMGDALNSVIPQRIATPATPATPAAPSAK